MTCALYIVRESNNSTLSNLIVIELYLDGEGNIWSSMHKSCNDEINRETQQIHQEYFIEALLLYNANMSIETKVTSDFVTHCHFIESGETKIVKSQRST